ncbi:MAG TPA: phage holin [Candidatus Scatomorpha pullistercoris]|uniref:Phage holin n=1 Tax=Candidatus Scatomorpha pullistercoris TaxID=2840929 RepID=A0A9D1G4G1_9FIRM|nr:phage holin [Candidatus Scatomorpha pullistercoris]
MINWKVRLKNKLFWLSMIPALLLLAQVVAGIFGFTLELEGIQAKLLDLVNAVFAVLTLLGVVADPTTEGISDSKLALSYDEPKKD